MAERKAKPAAKKAVSTKAADAVAAKPKNTRAAAAATPQKTAAGKMTAAAAKPKTTRATAAKKTAMPAAKKAPAAKKNVAQPTPEERYRMVQTAAYFIAERNGFSGCPTEYWAAAEREIAKRLGL